MKSFRVIAGLFIVFTVLISCKSDSKEQKIEAEKKVEQTQENKKAAEKKEIIPIDNGDNLIFPRLIFNEQTKLFASALTTSSLTNIFSESEKQYSVFAPSNDAFKVLPAELMTSLFSDTELLNKKMKGHIVEGKLDYNELSNKIAANGGSYTLKSISGSKIKATKDGNNINLKDDKGNVASVLDNKSINTKNGVIYIIDKVLSVN